MSAGILKAPSLFVGGHRPPLQADAELIHRQAQDDQSLIGTVNLPRIHNCLSVGALFVAYWITGALIPIFTSWYGHLFKENLPGRALPVLTFFALSYGKLHPIAINLILGLIFCGLLFFFEFGNEKRRAFIPFCLTVAFIFLIFQLTAVFLGLSMPFVPITVGMSNQATG